MQHPLPGFPVTYKYGVPDNSYKLTGHHVGTDYGAPIGTAIKAPTTGEIVLVGYSKILGNYFHYQYIHDGKPYTTRFLHLSKMPKRGKYNEGNDLGYTGNTGQSTGAHCHVDVWKDRVRTDIANRSNWMTLTEDPEIHFRN